MQDCALRPRSTTRCGHKKTLARHYSHSNVLQQRIHSIPSCKTVRSIHEAQLAVGIKTLLRAITFTAPRSNNAMNAAVQGSKHRARCFAPFGPLPRHRHQSTRLETERTSIQTHFARLTYLHRSQEGDALLCSTHRSIYELQHCDNSATIPGECGHDDTRLLDSKLANTSMWFEYMQSSRATCI